MAHHGNCGCRKCNVGWSSGGYVNDEPARTYEKGDRIEAIWGGKDSDGGGDDHGHIVTNDGLNAASVRYPDEDEYAFNDPDDKRQR